MAHWAVPSPVICKAVFLYTGTVAGGLLLDMEEFQVNRDWLAAVKGHSNELKTTQVLFAYKETVEKGLENKIRSDKGVGTTWRGQLEKMRNPALA